MHVWARLVAEFAPERALVFVVACKGDLVPLRPPHWQRDVQEALAALADMFEGRIVLADGGEGRAARVWWTSAETGAGVTELFESVARVGLAHSVGVADGVDDTALWARMRVAAGHDAMLDDSHISLSDPLGPRKPDSSALGIHCCQ